MSAIRYLRNLRIPLLTTMVLACFSDAGAQVTYRVTDLGAPRNDNFSMVMSVNKRGWTEIMAGNFAPNRGASLAANQGDYVPATPLNGRALIDIDGFKLDLGTLGGPNSWMNFGEINDVGQVVGDSETAVPDPNGEDICTFGTHLTCRPFLWQIGRGMSALPTLGGNNGQASAINNRGQIVGMAEDGAVDFSCPPKKTNNRIQLPVLWERGGERGSEHGREYSKAQALPTVDGDPDGFAFWINDHGQAVGFSGNCNGALHPVSWEDRTATPLLDYGHGGQAWSINNQGQIVGTVGSADGKTQTGALWQNDTLTNLHLLPGDVGGIAFDINSNGQVVGANWDSIFNWSHAFIWQNGVMTDLNTLFPADSNLFATFAAKINERGQIGGMAIVRNGPDKGDMHAFLATPVNERIDKSVADVSPTRPQSNLLAHCNHELLQRFPLGRSER